MASTPNKNRATSLGKNDQASSTRSPKSPIPPKQNKSKGPMGLSLLLIAIGTSLIGLGGLGYWFYQELLSSSRREVDRSAEAQTRQIEGKLADVQQTVDGVANAARILAQQPPKPKAAEAYQRLLVDGLQKNTSIAGMGIASSGNLLFTRTKTLVPYVWKEQSGLKPEISGQKLVAPNDKFISGDRPDILKAPFYQATLKGQASWSEPYTALGKTIISYSAPISDGSKVLGIVSADAIASELLLINATNIAADSESKIGFVVINASGKAISSSTQNPTEEALISLAQQAKTQPVGIAQTGGNLWAYRKIAGSDWLVATYLPEAEITNKLLILVGGTAVGLSAILAIAILGFVNSIKKRLEPLTEECDRFLNQQGNAGEAVAGKDEIERLSLLLKSTFQRVKTNEIHLRGELAQSSNSDDDTTAAQIKQNLAETQLMESEVGDLLDVVSSMEEGDLTIEAQVNDRATGLVADTLNRLREKLVEIISSVLGTAQQVAQGASDLEELARTVVLNTAEQAQSVTQGQALTEQVAAIAQRSAAQINVANQSLQEVRDTVTSGQTAINTLTESISVLQTGSAQIVQRMKTLGEFVGLAEQFVQDQGQIASLTQVLALNATLVAARAAEQKDPKQFAGVAREFEAIAGQVNDLATQTNGGLTVLQQRTSQIQTVVTAIDAEVQNLSGLVSGFTSGVEASQSAFDSIQSATEEVVQIGQTITESSTEIADAAGSTASYISEIAQLADRTANLTRSARQQAEDMGNQAQQLLQGIQFFRLPTLVSEAPASTVKDISTTPEVELPDTSTNSLLDSAPALDQFDAGLGFVAPAIAVAATTFAISVQASDATYTESNIDNLASSSQDGANLTDLDDEEYLFEENPEEEISNEFIENPEISSAFNLKFEQDLDSVTIPDSLSPEQEIADVFTSIGDHDQDQSVAASLDLTDMSDIEQALLDDLRQEVYEEYPLDNIDEYAINFEDELSADTVPNLKVPMEGVNEFAISEASIDPMIVSATSSFEDDTAFGTTPSLLAEDANANLPTSVDFSIPDLDDDFQIPKMDIESTLDSSNSFFDSNISTQEFDMNVTSDFDPFAIEDRAVVEPNNDAIVDDMFASNPLDERVSEEFDFMADDDYSIYKPNESLEESLETSSGEVFSSAFDMSFDESPFDMTFDQSFNDSLDETLGGNSNDSSQSIIEEELASLPDQVPDIYFETSADAGISEEFTFEQEESSSMSPDDLVESDNYLDLAESGSYNNNFSGSFFQESEEFIPDQLDVLTNIQGDENLDSESQLQEASDLSIDEQVDSDISYLFDESVAESLNAESDGFDDLDSIWQPEKANFEVPILSDAIESVEDIVDPFDSYISLQEEDADDDFVSEPAIASDPQTQESQMPALEELETNFPSLFDTSEEEILESEIDNLDDLIWHSEAIGSELSEDFPQSPTVDLSETRPSSFDLQDFSPITDDDLLDEVFSFDTSDDSDDNFTALPNSVEEIPLDSVEGLLSESELDASFIFSDILEEEIDFDYDEFLNDSVADSLSDAPENETTFSALTENIESEDIESVEPDSETIEFSDTLESSNSIPASILDDDIEESVIFNAVPNDLDLEVFANSSDFSLSEPSDLGLDTEFSEPNSDLSIDFSSNWFEEMTDEEDLGGETFADLDDLSIGYPSLENTSLDVSDDATYGFADNLLDSLMDEFDEEFEELSTNLLNLPTVSNLLPNTDSPNNETVEIEDNDSELESEFDFSALGTEVEDSIITARAEIDDFLAGTIGMEELTDENSKPKKNISSEHGDNI
jgi:twitching motility protein PilJ